MTYIFHASGHSNVTATHKTTLEFTKDAELNPEGECVLGVKASFELEAVKQFITSKTNEKDNTITVTIKCNDKVLDTVKGKLNKKFNDEKEMVIRKSDFLSDRTLLVNANKAACDLNSSLRDIIKNPQSKLEIHLT